MSTLASVIQRDIFTNRPGASIPGRLFHDTTNSTLYRDNGSSWDALGTFVGNALTTKGDLLAYDSALVRLPVGTNGQVLTADSTATPGIKWAAAGGSSAIVPLVGPTAPPSIGSLTWVNQGSATASNPSGSAITLTAPAAAGTELRALVATAPATPYKFDTHIFCCLQGINYQMAGLCFRNSSSGKIMAFYLVSSSAAGGLNGSIGVDYFSSASVAVTNLTRPPFAGSNQWSGFLRIEDDGTNRKYSVSSNGIDFQQIYSEGRTTQFTADQIGFMVSDQSNSKSAIATVDSWYVH